MDCFSSSMSRLTIGCPLCAGHRVFCPHTHMAVPGSSPFEPSLPGRAGQHRPGVQHAGAFLSESQRPAGVGVGGVPPGLPLPSCFPVPVEGGQRAGRTQDGAAEGGSELRQSTQDRKQLGQGPWAHLCGCAVARKAGWAGWGVMQSPPAGPSRVSAASVGGGPECPEPGGGHTVLQGRGRRLGPSSWALAGTCDQHSAWGCV